MARLYKIVVKILKVIGIFCIRDINVILQKFYTTKKVYDDTNQNETLVIKFNYFNVENKMLLKIFQL